MFHLFLGPWTQFIPSCPGNLLFFFSLFECMLKAGTKCQPVRIFTLNLLFPLTLYYTSTVNTIVRA
jgi:hypothetical protein